MPQTFATDIKAWAEKSMASYESAFKQIALALFTSVIKDTPVDTGRLRGNWVISSYKPKKKTVEIVDPTGSKSTANVEKHIRNLRVNRKAASVFLTNSLPYTARIEFDKHSKQAPQGMVRINAVRIAQKLKSKYG